MQYEGADPSGECSLSGIPGPDGYSGAGQHAYSISPDTVTCTHHVHKFTADYDYVCVNQLLHITELSLRSSSAWKQPSEQFLLLVISLPFP